MEGRLTPKRGDVYGVQLPMRDGSFERKHAVIVSRDSINAAMNVIVVRITDEDRHRSLPTAVELDHVTANLPSPSWALCHDAHTIPQEWLDPRPKGMLGLGDLIKIARALTHALDV